ncbi:hypothetical protein F993_03096 [Acinetobacter proteolyticus]|jgi:hypothetical protein|nr:DUF4442 domain-containing protein [Acinetobacter proteolyticus]QHH93301.1 DUF4442 domain-containing protein [Acinetobacter gyllenbergii]ENU22208.1 hypothetical protein F993_03096 [Acinetobacter proteolyticus]OEY92750.1 DUF4442 domain-containing protein [Acinetobacter proteolyticus]PKF37312.1 DUF4442 domain-containing protein [Acinetobacter proteolyticus]WEI20181.1 YiiD C-terminal domain-containing protein [Acinetobacter proteolyticus]
MKDFFKKIRTIPAISKFMLNHYSPYRGAGIAIETIDLDDYYIRVKMPLTRRNRNLVGTHFGGSLYSMVDPFYMLILIHHLGHKYIVWDKSATINFLSPGRNTVYAEIRLNADEITEIKKLAENHEPVLRHYSLNIVDDAGTRIAEVEKVLYIRRKKPKASA